MTPVSRKYEDVYKYGSRQMEIPAYNRRYSSTYKGKNIGMVSPGEHLL